MNENLALRAENKALAKRLRAVEQAVLSLQLTPQLDRSTVEIEGESVPVTGALAAGVEAVGLAGQALESANGKNRVIYSDVAPDVTEGMVTGDVWWQRDAGKRIIGQWQFDGTGWVETPIDGAILANIDAGSITFGTMRGIDFEAVNIRGSVIDGTDVRGQGLTIYDAEGARLASLASAGVFFYPKVQPTGFTVASRVGTSSYLSGERTLDFAIGQSGSGGGGDIANAQLSSTRGLFCNMFSTDGVFRFANSLNVERARIAPTNGGLVVTAGVSDFSGDVTAVGSSRAAQFLNSNGHPSAPFSIFTHSRNVGELAANTGATNFFLAFPSGRFTQNPVLAFASNQTDITFAFTGISVNGVTIVVTNRSTIARTPLVNITATQATATSGAG